MADLRDLRLTDFEPLVEASFRLTVEGLPEPLALRLVETRSLTRAQGAGERRLPFGLVFRGPRDPVLPQRIYRLEHETLGAQEIFLVPIRRDGEGTDYEAIFT